MSFVCICFNHYTQVSRFNSMLEVSFNSDYDNETLESTRTNIHYMTIPSSSSALVKFTLS